MATPPSVVHLDRVGSTQDEAARRFGGDPVLVTATGQDAGRGRSGATWIDADRALAASLAFASSWPIQRRPVITLVAGLAALDVLPDTVSLKWPNDLVVGDAKAGGILTEATDEMVVVGLGLNVAWSEPPAGMVGLHRSDPGVEHARRVAERWAEALLHRLESGPDRWGREAYLARCATVGRTVTWEPAGRGRAIDVTDDGALVVEDDDGTRELHSGVVREVRAG